MAWGQGIQGCVEDCCDRVRVCPFEQRGQGLEALRRFVVDGRNLENVHDVAVFAPELHITMRDARGRRSCLTLAATVRDVPALRGG